MNNSTIENDVLKYWETEHNCSQSTAAGILNNYHLSNEAIIMLKSLLPFGGGFKEGKVCGAVSGTLLALTLCLSNKNFTKDEILEKTALYKENFRKKFGHIDCGDLLQPFQMDQRSEEIVKLERRQFCTSIVKESALMAKEILDED